MKIRNDTEMTHYQIQKSCSICGRKIVVDITSIGSPHQNIEAVTCIECVPDKSKLLGDKIVELEFKPIKEQDSEIS